MNALELFDANKELLETYCADWGMSGGYVLMLAARDANDEQQLIKIANDIWFALPDRKAIRTSGFFKLCDIAELICGP